MKKLLLLLFPAVVWAQSSQWNPNVYIEQVGDNNIVSITQSDGDHTAHVALGANLPSASWSVGTTATVGATAGSDSNYIHITQKGTGDKTARVEIPSGYNNSVILLQDGIGNHTANVKNLVGNSNNISIGQDGPSNHVMNIVAQTGTTNSGNNINTTQSGSGNKTFDLTLAGTSGATVTVTQNNPTQANSVAMGIQCVTCGSYSYVRN
jgi:hypothetical protein